MNFQEWTLEIKHRPVEKFNDDSRTQWGTRGCVGHTSRLSREVRFRALIPDLRLSAKQGQKIFFFALILLLRFCFVSLD